MYRLGAQGRAAQQRLSQQEHYSSVVQFQNPVSQAQNDVNLLLSTLSNQNSKQQPNSLLSYVVHYFPKIKNENNLKLLTRVFLQNQIIFPFEPKIILEDSYMVIEAIKALFDSKFQISEPTLAPAKFMHTFVETLYESQIEPWKKVLVITGILLSQPVYLENSIPETKNYFLQTYSTLSNLNHELLVGQYKTVQLHSFAINSLNSIATACSLPFFTDAQRKQLPHENILLLTIDLLFQSPYGLANGNTLELSKSNSPVLKHLSRLSFLCENCLVNGVPFPILNETLKTILEFSITLSHRTFDSPQSWDFMKNILFSLVIIFQGFASFSLNLYNGLKPNQISSISSQILRSLYHLNFIIEKIGTGGFQAYNFVYLTTLDGLLQYSLKSAEELGKSFIYSINLSAIPQDQIECSKVLFTLIYFETLAQKCSEQYHNSVISPFVQSFIKNARPNQRPEFIKAQRSIIEASHSVILSTFSRSRNSIIISTTAIPYLHTVLSQFPTFLSSNQLRIAIEAITKSVAQSSPAYKLNKDNLREVLHTLYITILNTKPGIPLPTDQTPSTVRSSLISSLISVIPYIPAIYLENWLNNIWELVESSNAEEYAFCEDALWKLLSEGLDLQRSNVGIQWWYSHGSLESKL